MTTDRPRFDRSRYAMTHRRWYSMDADLDLVLSALADRAVETARQARRDHANARQQHIDDAARKLLSS